MAARFWVGGSGDLDGSTTTHISATSGGAGGASYPGVSDSLTLDANSGGGTVTMSAPLTITNFVCGAFTGTLNLAAHNQNMTLSLNSGFSMSGTGTRTITLGSNQIILTATTAGTIWNAATTTNLTWNPGTSNIVFDGNATAARIFAGGGLTYATVTQSANASKGGVNITGNNTIANLVSVAPATWILGNLTTTTITNDFTQVGTSSDRISILASGAATLSASSGTKTLTWGFLRGIAVAGGATWNATDTYDLGANSGWNTLTEPATTASDYQLFINV